MPPSAPTWSDPYGVVAFALGRVVLFPLLLAASYLAAWGLDTLARLLR